MRAAGRTIARLSVSAMEMNTVPRVGSSVNAPNWDLAKAVGKSRSMPMTSPVERISGPSTVSTTSPAAVRNRLKGSTAALTAMEPPSGIVRASRPGRSPWSRREAIVRPTWMRAAALASCTPVAFDAKGTVREARGFASMTYRVSESIANWMLMSPRTPTPLAMASVEAVMRPSSRADSVMGGSTHEESPEWTPASSMCSMIAPMNSSSPS